MARGSEVLAVHAQVAHRGGVASCVGASEARGIGYCPGLDTEGTLSFSTSPTKSLHAPSRETTLRDAEPVLPVQAGRRFYA